MFEEPGCAWCQRWHTEIGPGYAKSEEGRQAPLRRLDLRGGVPTELKQEKSVTMPPTFILIEEGVERGRLLGYPGIHFFHPMLGELLKRVQPAAAASGSVGAENPGTGTRR